MADLGSELTPEERLEAQRLFDERVRVASREQYRRMVAAQDPRLHQGPVRVPHEEVMRLREEIALEIRARRNPPPPPPPAKQRRWPWQR